MIRLFATVAILLFLAPFAHPLDIYANGRLFASYLRRDLDALAYTIEADGSHFPGIAVSELAPLYYFVESVELEIPDAESDGREPVEGVMNVADLGEIFVAIKDEIELIHRGKRYTDVSAIYLQGEEIEPGPGRGADLEVWISWEGTRDLEREIDRFADLHRLDILVSRVPDTEAKLRTIVRARGPVPDVVMVQSSSISPLVEVDALQRLDYLPIGNLSGDGIDAFVFDGSRWAVPFYADVQLLFYNPELIGDDLSRMLERPLTTSVLEIVAAAMLDRHGRDTVTPLAWNAYSAYWLVPFIRGFGRDELVAGDGTITIDDEPTRRAIDYLLTLRDRGYLEIVEKDPMLSRFALGKIGVILSGSYSIPLFEELGVSYGVSAFPVIDETGLPASPMLDYKGFAITRRTDAPVLARRLIEHLTGSGVQQRFCLELSKIPADSQARSVFASRAPYGDVMIESAVDGIGVPTVPAYRVYKNLLWKLLRLVYDQRLEVEEALETGERMMTQHQNPK